MRTLRILAWVVLAVSAVDAVITRIGLPHRATEARLYWEACALWGVLALLAWFPAQVTARAFARGAKPSDWTRGLCLLGWTAIPVLAHQTLDRFTSIGADTAALASPRPWIELAVVCLGAIGLLVGLAVALRGCLASWTGWVFALVCVLVGTSLPWTDGRFRSDQSAAAADHSRPNVLLMVWDTARAGSLSALGSERETSPELDRFAEDALVFERARSVTIFTFTSHLSMLTGQYPSGHGARLLDARYRGSKEDSIAEMFRKQGYRTGAFVGTGVLSANTGVSWGFEAFDDRVDPRVCDTRAWKLVHDLQSVAARTVSAMRFNGRPHWIEDFQRSAHEVLENAKSWIEEDDPRPWFCMVNMYDAHWPYLPGEPGREVLVGEYGGPMTGFGTRSNELFRTGYATTEEDERHMTELYEAELWELDRLVANFLGDIGIAEGRTGVVITSDHGEAFGEADVWEHDDIYEPQVHIPLIVREPGLKPQRGRVEDYASGVDVAPTLLGMGGIEVPEHWPGMNLLAERPGPERFILVEDRDHMEADDVRIALYRGSYKLQRNGCGDSAVVRLYDLRYDSIGERDVSDRHPDLVAELLALMKEHSGAFDCSEAQRLEGRSLGNSDALRGLGYVGSDDEEQSDESAGPPDR